MEAKRRSVRDTGATGVATGSRDGGSAAAGVAGVAGGSGDCGSSICNDLDTLADVEEARGWVMIFICFTFALPTPSFSTSNYGTRYDIP